MVNAPHLVALVRAGATFVNGKLVERPEDEAAEETGVEAALLQPHFARGPGWRFGIVLIWVRLDGDAAPGPGLTVAAEPTEAECRRRWTGGSTGPGMTPTVAAFAGRLKDGVAWILFEMTWPVSRSTPWNPLTYRCGSASATEATNMPYTVQKDPRADPPIYTCLPLCYVLPPTRTDSSLRVRAQRGGHRFR